MTMGTMERKNQNAVEAAMVAICRRPM